MRTGPFFQAAWPFKAKPKKPIEVNDPFQKYGAESQAALAREFAPASPNATASPSTTQPGTIPNTSFPHTNQQNDVIMAHTGAESELASTSAVPGARPYPWPAPVDTRMQAPGVELPADIWGQPAASQHASPPSTPPSIPQVATPEPAVPTPSIATTSLETPLAPVPVAPSTDPPAASPGGTPDLGTRVLAIVGNQTILANDLLTGIDDKIAKAAREAPPDMVNAELDNLFQKMLPKAIDYKLLYIEFLRMVPPEGIPAMEDQAGKHFTETELPKYFDRFNVNTLAEVDAKLRETGTTLVREKRLHFEMEVARQILPRLMKFDPEVSHDDRIEHYRKHIDEYFEPAQVRWERLTVNFDQCPSREVAFQQIAQMGNEILGGAPLADVAKRGSHCPRAAQGGMYDWTRFDSLASKPIENALTTIEPGKLSKIIVDDNGVHIVRVIERRQASYRSFEAAQEEILEKIREERFQTKMQSTLDRLRKETEIWTIYDPDSTANPMSPTPSGQQTWIQTPSAVRN